MSDTRQLSPQGYNIYDDPKNTNPFWGGDEPDDPTVYQRLTDLENAVDNIEDTMATESELDNYYDKDEIDDKFNAIPVIDIDDYSTTNEVLGLIADEHDNMLDILDLNYYDKTEMDGKLAVKANITAFNNYYTKSEVDALQLADDARLDSLETTVGNHTTDIGDLRTSVNGATSSASSAYNLAEDAIESAEASANLVADLSDDLDNAENDILSLQHDVSDLGNRVLALEGTVGDINSVLEVVLNGDNS